VNKVVDKIKIPFNKPCFVGGEIDYMIQAVKNGYISGDGPFTKKCEALLQQSIDVRKVLLTTSCTHALEMAALLLDIKPGDEVIVPSFTFVTTVNAFVMRGAKPVFVDIRQDTLNMDESRLEELISSRTKAIVPVHYAGVGCEMDTICQVAKRHNIPIVEDNAHGLFGKYKNRNLGTFGELATLSFHETKNFICGEGGALIVNDGDLCSRAEIVREKGTNRSQFFRGQVDKYTWVDLGSSYVISDILAAFLFAQLEAKDSILRKRQAIFERYVDTLIDWAKQNSCRLPEVPPYCEQSYHMFYLIMPSLDRRQELIRHLRSKEILSVFHYIPLHLSPMGRKWGYKPGDFPVTERISDCLLRLPFYNELQPHEQDQISSAIMSAI
jgi:dTDP-4-amino-4,6-dideoxygalactose transaminase